MNTGFCPFLMENKDAVVSRERLMDALWESDCYVDDNTLSVNVNRLRKKLEASGLSDFYRGRNSVWGIIFRRKRTGKSKEGGSKMRFAAQYLWDHRNIILLGNPVCRYFCRAFFICITCRSQRFCTRRAPLRHAGAVVCRRVSVRRKRTRSTDDWKKCSM